MMYAFGELVSRLLRATPGRQALMGMSVNVLTDWWVEPVDDNYPWQGHPHPSRAQLSIEGGGSRPSAFQTGVSVSTGRVSVWLPSAGLHVAKRIEEGL